MTIIYPLLDTLYTCIVGLVFVELERDLNHDFVLHNLCF